MNYKPPFNISPSILTLLQDTWKAIGSLSGLKLDQVPIKLRKSNSIKTIQCSLAIEGNTLTLDQVTDLFEGKRVIGPEKDILEVKNAISAYDILKELNPFNIKDLLKAHGLLMSGLHDPPGCWRQENVGIFKGDTMAHLPPSASRVPDLMTQLFSFLKEDTQTPLLLKACVFHYELEFIHPFMDGNGRIGRLWQQRILMEESAVFQYIPIEDLIKKQQERYYGVLGACDQDGSSTKFIEFSLELILDSLKQYTEKVAPQGATPQSRLRYAFLKIGETPFSRKSYMLVHRDISSATASRDLLYGLKHGFLKREGQKNQTLYQFMET